MPGNAGHESICLTEPCFARLDRHDHRIHLPAQTILPRMTDFDDVRERHRSDDQKIDIAVDSRFPCCNRTEDQRMRDLARQRREQAAQHVYQTGCLEEDPGEFFENRTSAIRLITHLIARRTSYQQPGIGQKPQLAVQGASGNPRQACEFTYVERLLGA